MEAERHLSDQGDRESAVTTPNHAFVQASAGTGKTHTLTLRALFLLLELADPELYEATSRKHRLAAARRIVLSIVLTTFTRKAAAEMQTRLYRYLDLLVQARSYESFRESAAVKRNPLFLTVIERVLARKPGIDFTRLQLGAEALAEQAAELQISTIHSLAASILRRHPLESGISPETRFAAEDDEALTDVDDALIDHWWQTEAFDNEKNRSDLDLILRTIPLTEIRSWLRSLLAQPWIPAELGRTSETNRIELERALKACRALAGFLAASSGPKMKRAGEELTRLVNGAETNTPGVFEGLVRFIWTNRGYLFLDGKTPKAVKEELASSPETYRSYFSTYSVLYRTFLSFCLKREYRETWSTWIGFLERFSLWSKNACLRELNILTFDEMIRLAVGLLKGHQSVGRFENARLKALLVDEFQDTDSIQLELLRTLISRPKGTDHEVLGFFVGDLKQSIYRFRGANVDSIRAFSRDFESLINARLKKREFLLTTSFRSRPSITGCVNPFFTDALKLTTEKEHLSAFRTEKGGKPRWLRFPTREDERNLSAYERRRAAAQATAQLVNEYLSGGSGEDPPRYEDILVLVRTGYELDVLLPELQDAGIPVVSSGAKSFYRHQEVLDALNLLICLCHPGDSLAVAAVLRSPLVHVSDEDIHQLLAQIRPCQVFHSDEPLPDSLPAPALGQIERLRELVRLKSTEYQIEWLHQAKRLLPQAVYVKNHDAEGRCIARITRVFDAFYQQVMQGTEPPIVWLIQQRDRVAKGDAWDSDLGEDVSVFDESVAAVRAMTIHKAKGLEGKYVIVYGWGSILGEIAGGSNRNENILSLESEFGDLNGLSMQWGPLRIVTPEYEKAWELEALNATSEGMRLAYVAATRARDRLVLFDPLSPRQKIPTALSELLGNETDGSACDYMDFVDWRPLKNEISARITPPVELNEKSYVRAWSGRFQQLRTPTPRLLSRPTDADLFPDEVKHYRDDLPYSSPSVGRIVGSIVHAYLEKRLLNSDVDSELVRKILLSFSDGQRNPVAFETVIATLKRFFSGEQVDIGGRSMIRRVRESKILGREVPVYLHIDAKPWHGVIDLILDESEVISGIDYKTGPRQDNLPFSYVNQQRVYQEALNQLFPQRKVCFEFWWLG
jgi:ATP-dependent exoDNAse (exonuclease V) beta subunit